MLNAKTMALPLAELLTRANEEGAAVDVEKPVPALIVVPPKEVTWLPLVVVVQVPAPLLPFR